MRKNCSSDYWEKLLKFEAEGREFAKILRSLEQFFLTLGQNNFGNKIPKLLLNFFFHKICLGTKYKVQSWIIHSMGEIKHIVENIEVVTLKIVLFFRWAWSPNKNSKSFEWTSYKTISRSNSGTHPFRSPGSSGKRQAKRTYRLHD